MTSNFPFEGVKSNHAVMAQIIRRNFPPVHGDGRVNLVVALANLVTACWNLDPSTRPVAKSCEREVYWMVRSPIMFIFALFSLTPKLRIARPQAIGMRADPLRFALLDC